MRTFLQRLLLASQWGASLVLTAGCGSEVEVENPSPDAGITDSGITDAGAPLDPTPPPECYGPEYDSGYWGQCCDIVLCATPVNGACPSATEVVLKGLPPGSGTCQCEETRGPYANTDPNATDACCYLVGSISCEGRPLLVHGAPRLPDLLQGPSAWSSLPKRPMSDKHGWRSFAEALAELDTSALPAQHRRRLAQLWAERGRNEHASVASFGRFSLALMALGAPPELIEAAHRAALDEVRHARLAISLASAYGEEPLGFGALRVDGAFEDLDSLEAMAIATVVEGCIGETLSAIEAATAAAQAGPRAVRVALEVIARDEARHAELAWAFVRWAVGKGGPTLRTRVAAAFARALERVCEDAGAQGEDELAAHGFLPPEELAQLRRQAAKEVLRPAAAALCQISSQKGGSALMAGVRASIVDDGHRLPLHELAAGGR